MLIGLSLSHALGTAELSSFMRRKVVNLVPLSWYRQQALVFPLSILGFQYLVRFLCTSNSRFCFDTHHFRGRLFQVCNHTTALWKHLRLVLSSSINISRGSIYIRILGLDLLDLLPPILQDLKFFVELCRTPILGQ